MLRIVTSPCDCRHWEAIGVDTDNIPECVFGGIHWYTNTQQAVEKWRSLRRMNAPYRAALIPYYWAVHINGEHINSVLEE